MTGGPKSLGSSVFVRTGYVRRLWRLSDGSVQPFRSRVVEAYDAPAWRLLLPVDSPKTRYLGRDDFAKAMDFRWKQPFDSPGSSV